VTQDIISRFFRVLQEFDNSVIMPLLVNIKFNDCDDDFQDYYKEPGVIDRLTADEFKSLGKQELPNQFKTIFSQLFKSLPAKNFITNNEYAFRVRLKGEGAYDAGGPRREVISNMCSELMSPVLSILIPTSNNLGNYGEFTQCYTLNPNATNLLELYRIQFFGHMLGWSINSRQGLGLDLAPHIWKRIVHGVEVKMTLEDLNKVDTR
jgi:hypothetical protein